ncbi:MAG: rod shape-determining protein MreC [Chitinophagaceae bacterium]|nr:rod shape-determining protein MreC [Chitinophagaceae bacterium]MBK8784941.1 rod shape-determining protein MreC [Chitinophagaceae bacterium]MBK9484139.1 rod shape-determining protein MreC [Chitinophagaceae bacterium]MBL0198739.1 rod shape-determining protein MreC [Chitinophagaceae bacterium]
MRNIFLFVRRYFNFILFLLLQGFSIYLIVHYSNYHNAIFSKTSNQVTGKINEKFNSVTSYFRLKKTNDSLVAANEMLYNKLKADFEYPDTTSRLKIDSIKVDSMEQFRKYQYYPARVVYNSVAAQNNFIVLGRGSSQNIKLGMGVIDPNSGVVGVVTEVSSGYAVVMSLLHKDSHLSGKLLKGGETGTLNWDGKTPNIISLAGIPKGVKVVKGDTIISSGFSTSIPKGMMMGIVEEVKSDKSTNNHLIKFRTAANFYNLEFAYVIENKQTEEIKSILEKEKQKSQ